jgi:magnesium chelatase family protein
MLARCLPSILPPLTLEEALEVTAVYSVAGALPDGVSLVRQRPFRCPHHTISQVGLAGGGSWPRPGEISLAHHGVLFLDELPEFGRGALEALRQPMEDRIVSISRAAGRASYPAGFSLIAARNPCPCGHHLDPGHECTCSAAAIDRYSRRISGPLLDRIDVHIDVPRVADGALLAEGTAEPSCAVRKRVAGARAIQAARFGLSADESSGRSVDAASYPHDFGVRTPSTHCNGEMTAREVREYCRLGPASRRVLGDAMGRHSLSARSVHRVLKLARTIADLDDSADIDCPHLSEALHYRLRGLT